MEKAIFNIGPNCLCFISNNTIFARTAPIGPIFAHPADTQQWFRVFWIGRNPRRPKCIYKTFYPPSLFCWWSFQLLSELLGIKLLYRTFPHTLPSNVSLTPISPGIRDGREGRNGALKMLLCDKDFHEIDLHQFIDSFARPPRQFSHKW